MLKAGSAIKLHPALVRFYESLLAEFEPAQEVFINVLRVGGVVIASQFGVRDPDTLHILKIAYDETRGRLAPGNILMEHTIETGCRDGAYAFVDIGNPPWSGDWNVRSTPLFDLSVYNRTPIGLAQLAATDAREWLKPRLKPWIERYRKRQEAPAQPA